MGDIKLKPVSGFETSPYSSNTITFRLEKRKGCFDKGMRLQKTAKAYAVFKNVAGKSKFKMGLKRKAGGFVPAITKGSFGYEASTVVSGMGSSCSGGIVSFANALKGVQVLETHVGYFNADKLIDIAYTVKHPQHGVMSYVFYGDDLYRCVAKTENKESRSAWKRFDQVVIGYVSAFGKISPSMLKKFHAFTKLAMKGKESARDQKIWWTHLSGFLGYAKAVHAKQADCVRFIEGVFTAAADGRVNIVRMFVDLAKGRFSEKPQILRDFKTLLKLSKGLTADQFRAIEYLYDHNKVKGSIKTVFAKLAKLVLNHSGKDLYKKAYKLFGGFNGISAASFAGYAEIMRNEINLNVKDIRAAEASIGSKGAVTLFRKFRLTRFGRYHSSMLKHMVRVATDPTYMRDKPLIFATTARYDDTNMFYWGKGFKHDPETRVVIVEVNNYDEFKEMSWKIRNEYGIPGSMLITAHGTSNSIHLGSGGKVKKGRDGAITLKDYAMMKRDFEGFFGAKRGYIVLNACSTGARIGNNRMNVAQMFANALNAEVRAARAVEGLLSVGVVVDHKGRVRLNPTFFEIGSKHFGFNHGGSVFLPNKTGKVPERVYNGPADANTGWKVGGGMSTIGRDISVDMFVGYSKALWHRLRLKADLGVHYHPIKGVVSPSFDPEVAVGIVNQFMLFTGGRFGATIGKGGQVKPLYQANFGVKFIIPYINGEIDIGGASVNGKKPKFFFKFQGGF